MKKSIVMMLVVAIMLNMFPGVFAKELNPDVSNWFQWEMPDDKKAKGTAIDASFMLDAPSGKHGFVHAQGENMYYEDGTLARYWGTNVVATANFESKENIEKLVDRIVRSGYNLVRFHHLDATFYSPNIFGANSGTTRKLDAKQLDKVFYFMSLLKERGVYYYVDLLVKRSPNEAADKIPSPNELRDGWTEASVFDTNLINLQKEYANQLLTTVNPYTNLSLANDPSLIFLDIHNEDSLFSLGNNSLGTDPLANGYYKTELNNLFNTWLKTKYASEAALVAAWTQSGKIALESGESYTNSTIRMPVNYKSKNYSDARGKDCYEFIYYTETNMYNDMKAYLKSIGVKCLITGASVGTYQEKPIVYHALTDTSDFIDRHNYNAFPADWYNDGGKLWNQESSITRQNGRYLINFPAWQRIYGKPFVLGEWQQCLPHEYRAEASIMMAAYSCFQNWNPIQFCLLEERMPTATTPMQNPFYTYTDPVYTSVNPAAAIIFHRYDVPEAKDVYYQPYDKAKAMNLVTSCINPGESESVSTISPYAKVGTVFTDLIDNPEVRKESERTRLISKAANREKQSNEIDWNNRAGTFKINTPFTNSATGTISGEAMDFTDSKMNINTEFATVTLNSVTKDNLAVSKRMLLTCVANARNTGFSMASVGQIGKVGKAPILVEPVVGQIEIKTRPEDTIVVFALDSSGQRKASVPVTKATNGYSSFRVDGTYKSVHYEIVRGGENQVNVEINNQTGRVNVSGTVNSQNPQDKNVTILAALTADIGSITDENAASKAITIAQLKTDNLGSFVYDFTMPPNAEGGSYTVVVLFEGSQTQIKKEFIYVKTLDPNALKITVDNVTKEIRVVGKSDKIEKRVTMRVFDPMYSLPDTTASNIGKYTCAINQGMTDNNGGFDMRFKLGPYAGSGTYSVKVAVGNNDIRTDTFEYKGMREGVVSVDSALNTKCVVNTGVYKKPLAMDAVTTIDNTSEYFIKLRTNNALLKECTASLIIATYRKGQMVDYKFENIIVPQMSSAEISKNLATDKMQSGDKVKIFLWQPDESIASITDAIELDVS